MELFASDRDRLAFLLETDAAFWIAECGTRNGELEKSLEGDDRQSAFAIPHSEMRPKYLTNYIGSKQKPVDWIWKHRFE